MEFQFQRQAGWIYICALHCMVPWVWWTENKYPRRDSHPRFMLVLHIQPSLIHYVCTKCSQKRIEKFIDFIACGNHNMHLLHKCWQCTKSFAEHAPPKTIVLYCQTWNWLNGLGHICCECRHAAQLCTHWHAQVLLQGQKLSSTFLKIPIKKYNAEFHATCLGWIALKVANSTSMHEENESGCEFRISSVNNYTMVHCVAIVNCTLIKTPPCRNHVWHIYKSFCV